MMAERKIRAWTDECGGGPGVVAAYVGLLEGDTPLRRPPAVRLCASAEKARGWIPRSERTANGFASPRPNFMLRAD